MKCITVTILFVLLIIQLTFHKRTITGFIADSNAVCRCVVAGMLYCIAHAHFIQQTVDASKF